MMPYVGSSIIPFCQRILMDNTRTMGQLVMQIWSDFASHFDIFLKTGLLVLKFQLFLEWFYFVTN